MLFRSPGSEGVNPITMIDLVTYNVCAQVFEYLVRSAADLSIQPQLATKWEATKDDATEWTFTLREGVMWQDGTPLTAKDVVATMDRLVDAGNTVIMVEHTMRVAAACDWVIDIGPGAGEAGGTVVASGPPVRVAASRRSRTAPYLAEYLR